MKQRILKQRMIVKKSKKNLPNNILKCIKEKKIFSKHIILETDKNQGPAIMERSDHEIWILEYLDNPELYAKIDEKNFKLITSNIRNYFYKWPSYSQWFDTINEKFGKFFGLPIISIKGTILERVSALLKTLRSFLF